MISFLLETHKILLDHLVVMHDQYVMEMCRECRNNHEKNVELRQAIEKQLNKIELANRFTRSVAVGDPRGFTQAEKTEQEIAEACNRLIKNSIICWNYMYLDNKLARLEKQSEQWQVLFSAVANHSVMAWAHINLLREYDFSDEKLQDTFGIRPPKLVA